MKYSKPEIVVLGDADRLIEQTDCTKKTADPTDHVTPCNGHIGPASAYDLDE